MDPVPHPAQEEARPQDYLAARSSARKAVMDTTATAVAHPHHNKPDRSRAVTMGETAMEATADPAAAAAAAATTPQLLEGTAHRSNNPEVVVAAAAVAKYDFGSPRSKTRRSRRNTSLATCKLIFLFKSGSGRGVL